MITLISIRAITFVTDSIVHNNGWFSTNLVYFTGVATRIAGNGDVYMHNKFCLIDVLTDETKFKENTHPLNGVLINGSMNWTTNVRMKMTFTSDDSKKNVSNLFCFLFQAFERNWENIIFTSDEQLKSEFKKAFDYIWARCAWLSFIDARLDRIPGCC